MDFISSFYEHNNILLQQEIKWKRNNFFLQLRQKLEWGKTKRITFWWCQCSRIWQTSSNMPLIRKLILRSEVYCYFVFDFCTIATLSAILLIQDMLVSWCRHKRTSLNCLMNLHHAKIMIFVLHDAYALN